MGAVTLTAADLLARTKAANKAAEDEAAALADLSENHLRVMSLLTMIAAINKQLHDFWQMMAQNMK